LDTYKFELEHFCNTDLSEMGNAEELQKKGAIKVAGIVSTFAHRTTKSGKPFGTLTLDDYNGTHSFFLFGDDYLKFKEYLMQDWYLFITGRVEKQKWGEQRLEFKIQTIELLNDLRDKRSKGFEVYVNLDELDYDFVDGLETLCSENKGDCTLTIKIVDREENTNVELLSRKYKINPSNEMINKMNQKKIHYKVMV